MEYEQSAAVPAASPVAAPAPTVLPTITQLFSASFKYTCTSFWSWLAYGLIGLAAVFFINVVLGMVGGVVLLALHISPLILQVVTSIVSMITNIWFSLVAVAFLLSDPSTRTIGGVFAVANERFASGFKTMLVSASLVYGGLVFFLVPGIMMSAYLFPILYVLFFEGHSGVAAAKRSLQLTIGHFWYVVRAILSVGLLVVASYVIVVFGGIFTMAAGGPFAGLAMGAILFVAISIFASLLGVHLMYQIYSVLVQLPPRTTSSMFEGAFFTICLYLGAFILILSLVGGNLLADKLRNIDKESTRTTSALNTLPIR